MRALVLFTLLVATYLVLLKFPTHWSNLLSTGLAYSLLVVSLLFCAYSSNSQVRRISLVLGTALTLCLSIAPLLDLPYVYLRDMLDPGWIDRPQDQSILTEGNVQLVHQQFLAVMASCTIAFIQAFRPKPFPHWPYMVLAAFAVCGALLEPIRQCLNPFPTRQSIYGAWSLSQLAAFAVVLTICAGLELILEEDRKLTRPKWLSSAVSAALLLSSNPLFIRHSACRLPL